jgi:hypothetical protein
MSVNNPSFLPISLRMHTRGYQVSSLDYLQALTTGFSGAPYARRHFELGFQSSQHRIWHYMIGCVETLPFFVGGLAALIERIAVCVHEKIKKSHKSTLPNKSILPLVKVPNSKAEALVGLHALYHGM